MGYTTVFLEDFNYADGALNLYDNWRALGPIRYFVEDHQVHATTPMTESVGCTNDGVINFPETSKIVRFVGKIGVHRGAQNEYHYVTLSSSDGANVGSSWTWLLGIGFKEGAVPERNLELIGWDKPSWNCIDSSPGIVQDVLYPFDIIYDMGDGIRPQQYLKFVFNGYDYIDGINGTNTTSKPQSVFMNISSVGSSGFAGWYNGFGVEKQVTKNNYLNVPRWQKTRWGMRPFY